MIIPSKPCTFRRYLALVASPLSQLRFFEYEKLSGVFLPGRTIDVGGRKNSAYRRLLRIESEMLALNIASETWGGADILADCNKPLPLEDNSFDSLFSANTLEHIKNDELALRESMRILKPGGHFHIMVPFLNCEHGCPYDFHRHTAQWWNELLQELGLPDEAFTVEPLVWDNIATGSSFFDGFASRLGRFYKPFIRILFCLPGLLVEIFRIRKSRAFVDAHALAFYISGVKS